MTLAALADMEQRGDLDWPALLDEPPKLEPHGVELTWNSNPRELVTWLREESFKIENGLIEFAPLQNANKEAKVEIHKAVIGTFLQHGRTRGLKKGLVTHPVQIDETLLLLSYAEVQWYAHQKAESLLCDGDDWTTIVPLTGWLAPGGVVRHTAFPNDTALEEPPQRALLLLFAPIGCFYFNLRSNIQQQKSRFALVIPEINDLTKYALAHQDIRNKNLKEHVACGTGDAGLKFALHLKAKQKKDRIDCDSCQVFTLGTVPWSSQQKTRTAAIRVDLRSADKLRIYEKLEGALQNRVVPGKINAKGEREGGFIATSTALEHFSENLVKDRIWYADFADLMANADTHDKVKFERKGLTDVIEKMKSELDDREQALVRACHLALGRRYRDIRNNNSNEEVIKSLQGREYDRMRVKLARCKNASAVRQELIDFWTRGGHQEALQENWQKVFPLLEEDWARARDLSLLALVSYKPPPKSDGGQGKENTKVE